jgi:guanylate kinase
MIVVLSGPGGVGKGAIAARLADREPSLWLSRSWTTRRPRVDDAPDAYVFVDRAHFEAHRDAGGFLEWNEFRGNLYGTPMPDANLGRDVLLEIDVNGGRQVIERDPTALLLFVVAPSEAVQRARLLGRGESPEQAEARIVEGRREIAAARAAGYRFVLNDVLDVAVEELRAAIARHRTGVTGA